jgi:predicted phage terminase large subunit-like protein
MATSGRRIEVGGPARRAEAELCRRSFARFFRKSWAALEPTTPLEWNWHLDAMCEHLQVLIEDWIRMQLARQEKIPEDSELEAECFRLGLIIDENRRVAEVRQRIRNLLENVPPGTAKSRIVSVALPAWVWTRWPTWKAIFLSVNPRLALRDSVLCRQLIVSDWYQETFQPGWTFAEDQDTKGLFKNTSGGWRMAIGYFANMVGDRGDALLIDDPNDPEEVYSEASRASTNERYDNTLKNRLNDLRSSVRAVIQQRVHPDDLSGHILNEAANDEPWEHVRISMEREGPPKEGQEPPCGCPTCTRGETSIGWKDPRAPGELMDPKRFPDEVLKPFRSKSMVWAAQYQQDPLDASGNMFKPEWWRFWRHPWEPIIDKFADRTVVLPETFDANALSLDCSFLKTEGSDLIAGGVWRRKGANKFLVDLEWDRHDFKETLEIFKHQAATYPEAREKFVENKANGPGVISMLKDEIAGIIPIKPEEYGSKVSRAAITAPQVESGNIYIPLHAPWRDRYIGQHTTFPNGLHDDAVDQQSQVLLRWETRAAPTHNQKRGQYGGRRM